MRTDLKPLKPSISKPDGKIRQTGPRPDPETKFADTLDKIEGWLNSRELQPPK